jgi:hypothetical protein
MSFTGTTATPGAESTAQIEERLKLESAMRSGADWFFWIAGLSLINAISAASGSTWGFIFGLGVTTVVTLVAKDLGPAAQFIGLGVTLTICGVLVVFGVFARKRARWAFLAGMACYGLDGLVSVLISDWLGAAVHAFALFLIFGGYGALQKLEQMPGAPHAA